MNTRFSLVVLALAGLACAPDQSSTHGTGGPLFARADVPDGAELVAFMDAVNATLESEGSTYRMAVAEYMTPAGGSAVGSTILQKDVGNKQLGADFIPNDPRRGWSGPVGGATDNITFAIDQTGDAVPVFGGATAAQTTAAIRSAMASWDAEVCSDLSLTENGTGGLDIGIVAFQNGLGGSPFVFADVQHAGFRDINFAGGILGVTFTFIFVSAGAPTDVDGNGLLDVAFREIYYDPSFNWRVDGVGNIDVESVALHEAGHGLSQAHFGNIFERNDGSFDASPRAVMNAFYQAPFRALTGTDNGGHCSNWANWPNN